MTAKNRNLTLSKLPITFLERINRHKGNDAGSVHVDQDSPKAVAPSQWNIADGR